MPFYLFQWTPEICKHIAEHGVDPEDFEAVVQHPTQTGFSRSTGRPTAVGRDTQGRRLYCVYEMLDETTVLPVTAYEI
jgi:uncharacterized DUF497 family protein